MTTYYEISSTVVAVETYCPGQGSMRIGVGNDWYEAKESMEPTPVEGHLDESKGLQWAIEAGWFDYDTEIDDFEQVEAPICQCECSCGNEAMTRDEGNDLCESCASNYAYDEDGMFLGCEESGLGETCPHCEQDIDWGGVETDNSGCGGPNYRQGDCGCGEGTWLEEDRGGWGHFSYHGKNQ